MSAAVENRRAYVNLAAGDPVPWFYQRSSAHPRQAFDRVAGRYIVLCFFATAGDAVGQAALAAVQENRLLFDDEKVCFFGVSIDSADERSGRARESLPGLRFFWDFDCSVSRAYGSVPRDHATTESTIVARRFWLVIDPTLRVLTSIPFASDGSDRAALFRLLESLPPPARFSGVELQAPILFLPNVFEPELCRRLIDAYETHGGVESGFMREVDGKTVVVNDPAHKRRKDHNIEDAALIDQTRMRIARRIVPEIAKAHQFHVTRMERFTVSCYAAEDSGHFNPHRDNTTKGTAHRRFAVSLNLNDDYEGGEIRFPEYGPRGFKPPPGAAVVFSCSLLHAAGTVTRGRRYVFLPFLYDEAAAEIRMQNNKYLDPAVGQYRG